MIKREDFKNVVIPFFDKLRSFDDKIHGNLPDYVITSYLSCLANKSEYVDYNFVPEGLDISKVKLIENMLIASHAFRLVISEVEKCSDKDMIDIYDNFRKIGLDLGWDSLEFDKSCLGLMGIEIKKVDPPPHLPSLQSGKDYN